MKMPLRELTPHYEEFLKLLEFQGINVIKSLYLNTILVVGPGTQMSGQLLQQQL